MKGTQDVGHEIKNIAVVIPCYNESKGIAKVIKKFPHDRLAKYGYEIKIFVVDNNSTDTTAEVALGAGATVIHEPKKGKGNALRKGFKSLPSDIDYVAMLDGDDTYSPRELLRMVEPLHSGFAEVVIGSRLGGKIHGDSMKAFNRFGNWFFTHAVRYFYRVGVTDVLTGYFAWNKDKLDELYPHLTSDGFAIEMEMITKMAKLGHDITSVPISYHQRAGDSNLRPVYDGWRIFKMLVKNLRWKPSPSKKKIAYVTDSVYPYNKGGKEKRLYEISQRLAQNGHDVHIYTMHWWPTSEKVITENGVTLHALCKYYPMYAGDRRSIKEGLLFSLACLKLIREPLDIVDVDHMPFFPVFTTRIVCFLKRKKMYGTWHEALSTKEWTAYMGIGGYIAAIIESLSIRLPYKITAASTHTRELLAANHHRTKRVTTVASGINTEVIAKVAPAKSPCDVLYVGRLVKDKNVDVLVRAFAKVAKNNKKARCVIIGHGIEKENIARLISREKINKQISLMDPLVEDTDVYAYMKKAKVFVLPSSREGFGIVALEALACGTPVITSDAPSNAARLLIKDGQTGSVTAITPDALSQTISFWLEKDSATINDSSISDYDWRIIANKQVEVYS